MTQTSPVSSRGFQARWVLLSALGWAAGLAVGLGLAEPVGAVVGMMLVTPVTLGLTGSVFGASQWLAVRPRPGAGLAWIAASAVALGAGMTVGIVVVELAGRAIAGAQVGFFTLDPLARGLGLACIGTTTGLAVGAGQCVALRAWTHAGRWIAHCAVAFGLGLPGGALAADALLGGLQSPAGLATFVGVAGLIVGAITAGAAGRLPFGRPTTRAA